MPNDWTYDEWQQALIRSFLQQTPAKVPVTFFADRQELVRLFGTAQAEPTESLTRAAGSALRFDYQSGLFVEVKRRVARWKLDGTPGPPPVLPILVLSVVAATEMRWEGGLSASAYYPRLAELFETAGVTISAEQLRDSFDDVPGMWKALAHWIEQVREPGGMLPLLDSRFTRIGYSLSQAVIRASDRARITTFFDTIALDPANPPSPSMLLSDLRLWTTRERGLTERFKAALRDDSAEQLILPTIVQLASAWDGVVVATGGRRYLPIKLSLDFDEWNASWAIPTQTGVESQTLETIDGASFDISWPEYGPLYDVVGPIPDVANSIGAKFRASNDRCLAFHSASTLYVLAFDDRAARWLQTDGAEANEEHVLVVEKSRQSDIEEILRTAAEAGWARVVQRPATALIPGWIIYRDVVFTNAQTFAQSLSAKDRVFAEGLRPDRAPVPRLANGLDMPVPFGSKHHYLKDGEPDLLLPMGDSPRSVVVSLDGKSETLSTSDFPIPLRAPGNPLAPGRHILQIEGRTIEFHICEVAVTTSVGAPIDQRPPVFRWSDQVYRGSVPSIRTLPRNGSAETWSISADGSSQRIHAPQLPHWLTEAGLPEPVRFEPALSDGAVWLVRILGHRVLSVSRVGAHPPRLRGLDTNTARLLGNISRSNITKTPLLKEYIKASQKWSKA